MRLPLSARVEMFLWLACAALGAAALLQTIRVVQSSATRGGAGGVEVPALSPVIQVKAARVVGNPFARDRRFAKQTEAVPADSLASRGRYALIAVAGGPPWVAVIAHDDGAGAREFLRVGDSLGAAQVVAISLDAVVLRTVAAPETLYVAREKP